MNKYLRLIIYTVLFTISFCSLSAQYWEKATVPAAYQNSYWLDVYFLPSNPQYGWVCGFDGDVLRTTDGGATWRGTTVANANHMESIHFPTTTTGYLTGSDGKIFKSNDGGATWSELNIPQLDSGRTWGLYFVSANTGVATGGGCAGYQYFWRTTDGGTNWSLRKDSVTNSGLTDPILYQADGVGFAVSSGNIWRTNDGGVTWNVEFSTGTNIWHEEITNVGDSFLVPYSGVSCTGGANGGGMRFTTNYGNTWRSVATGQRMFGAFLHDEQTGWAVGDNRAVYYTEDAGLTWELKNCGIEPGHMDDIWFISRNTGWVVGSSGVYKYVVGTQEVSKSEIGFPNACVPNIESDLFYVINKNMEDVRVTYTITGPDAAEFSITQPNSGFNISACDSVMVRVAFQPQTAGVKDAQINLNIDNGNRLVVELKGWAKESTAFPHDTLITIDPAPVGQRSSADAVWTVELDNEFIVDAQIIEGNTDFKFDETLDKALYREQRNFTKFSIVPRDTGWTSARFRIRLEPCGRDTFITVRAYGVSSIISAGEFDTYQLDCIDSKFDTLEIKNNGNIDLVINNVEIVNTNIGFSVVGWTSGNNVPITIQSGKADSIIVRFASNQPGNYNTLLRLFNNDNTETRGIVNPLDIQLSAVYNQTYLSVRDTIIDFGRVCIGETKDSITILTNPDGVTAYINNPFWESNVFSVKPQKTYPIRVDGNGSSELTLSFSPDGRRFFIDTLYLESLPCDEILRIIVKGYGIESDFVVKPFDVNRVVKTGEPESIMINIENTGNLDISIENIYLNPSVTNVQFNIISPLPDILQIGENRDYELELTSVVDAQILSQICVETTSECPLTKCINLDVISMTTKLYADRSAVDFGYKTCDAGDYFDSVRVFNEGATTERIENVYFSPSLSEFSIVEPTTFPQSINPDEDISIVIKYSAPSEGLSQTSLIIETSDGANDRFEVNINAEYRNVTTTPLNPIVDFAEAEDCEDIRSQSITFTNQGTIEDTLLVERNAGFGYSIEPQDIVYVPAGSTADITVSFDPSKFSGVNDYPSFFELRSIVCNTKYIVEVNGRIIKPDITIDPDEIIFQDIWVGDSDTKTVVISNNSGYSKTIDEIKIIPDNASYIADITTPFDIDNNEEVTFPIIFSGDQEGSFIRKLEIVHITQCPETTYVDISGNVPNENYDVELKIGDYVQEPGDIFKVHLELLGEVYKFKPESFSVEIGFNPKLFEPHAVFVLNEGDYILINNFSNNDGILQFTIDQEYSEPLFDHAAVIVMIEGTALVSSPSFTPLTLNAVDFVPNRNINLTTDNGSLEVIGFCWIRGELELESLNTINIQSIDQIVTNNTALYRYTASGKLDIYSEIIDFNGNRFAQNYLSINEMTGVIKLNTENLISGIYLVRFRTEYGVIYQSKLIVVH